MGFFDRPQLPGAQPMPEPPGNNIAREMLLRRMMQHSINPYGMSPEGGAGMGGQPLFSTGLNPAPAFGMTSRGDIGDPFFRQSFLGGPQYAKGQDIWDRLGSGGMAPGDNMGGSMQPKPALAGSRVALNTRMSPVPSAGQGGGSVQSLLQMLMQILQGGGGSSPQSFFNGRRVGTRRRFYNGRTFYDAIDPNREDDGGDTVPKPNSLSPTGRLTPTTATNTRLGDEWGILGGMGGGGPQRGGTQTVGNRLSGTPIPTDAGPFPDGDPLAQPPAKKPYVRSEHAVNWGNSGPYSGQFQYDSNGYPIGPGGFRYTGAQHEFSGGIGQQNVGQVNSASGGPSYAQWIEEVRRVQGDKSRQNATDSLARMDKYGKPEDRATGNAKNWLMQHMPGGGSPAQPPAQPQNPNGGNNTNSPY